MRVIPQTLMPVAALLLGLSAAAAQEPALPAGLDEPALPDGLDDAPTAVPGPDPAREAESASAGLVVFRGFAELRGGGRLQDDPNEDRGALAESRLRLDLQADGGTVGAQLVGDLVLDALTDDRTPALETGEGAFDLREASLALSPHSALDLKLGRQVLTWGTGDLLFINDLFPKDWNAFILGRDIELLKAPSDAAKLSAYGPGVSLDLVWTPRFDADRLPLRERVSGWDPALRRLAGQDDPLRLARPEAWIDDGEYAARLYGSIGGAELALYGYRGFWKSPAGVAPDPAGPVYTFPALSVYGGSARGPLLGGIASAEIGWYDSSDDRAGDDPLVRNGELRGLVGFEREVASELTLGVQYELDWLLEVDALRASLPPGAEAVDAGRHQLTARLTWLALQQRLMVTLFGLYSPSDSDAFIRPRLAYSIDDHWRADLGANLFLGRDDDTPYGQLARNSSAYSAVRYSW